ncbi:hypothetical protein BC332_05899 [Capsicum chinense]|nr:hypothetical protein BC332_05899 [Capsicum chinense]
MGTIHFNAVTAICILYLINTICLAFSQPSTAECILQLGKFSAADNTGGECRNWGNFLNNEACEGSFQDYLYATGIRANETGEMYLNSTQQTNCLTKMNDEGNGVDVFGCGIEKLTKTGGSWNDIKEMHAENDKYMEVESDICRFSVLVSLISTTITDQAWIRKLYNCLSKQQQPVNSAHTEEKDQEAEEHSELTEKHKLRSAIDMTMPKGSSLEVSIEEVYSATNYLNESNFIGEGTAGRVYRGILSNNQEVAIKHIIHEECIETFLREVRSLTNVRHPNLVALLGYSKNAKECFLIYEICPNGNLSQWLFALFSQHKYRVNLLRKAQVDG